MKTTKLSYLPYLYSAWKRGRLHNKWFRQYRNAFDEDDLRIVRREYPTDIGPVDLLCRDGEGRAVVIEVKRIGEIAGVEQLLRYQERLDLDATLAPTNGLFVATRIKPQARVFAESRGVECIEVDLERLRGDAPPDLRLF